MAGGDAVFLDARVSKVGDKMGEKLVNYAMREGARAGGGFA